MGFIVIITEDIFANVFKIIRNRLLNFLHRAIDRAALIHIDLVGIHPFIDGNDHAHTNRDNARFVSMVAEILDRTFDFYLRLV
ncbi:Fic family protein [Cohnella nanjingensis]|uniref:Fic family protein n=1 Tax=Cohnella nanjingensis TaxID=1387779 RepID=UPI0028B06D07|nr:Fic family protein [Cohnella nanjingensis]